MHHATEVAYGVGTLPAGIRSRFVDNSNGLTMHVLEAAADGPPRPTVLLLHGFPELAYSWRRVLVPLAEAGFRVLAPDQRGYGRTTGWDGRYDGDLSSYHALNLVRDILGLVAALGLTEVACVVGHDFGSPIAAWCALLRPDIFRSVVLMSAPFAGPPRLPFTTGHAVPQTDARTQPTLDEELAALPHPRKHYTAYYASREADENMRHCPQGIHDFLRAYYHYKSADWGQNQPFPLNSRSAEEFAKLPTYYVMDRDKGMAETVAEHMPSADEVAACTWLPEAELRVYSEEFARTGFQGGLQWYRAMREPRNAAQLQVFSGRAIEVPACFIAGASDWGVYQTPGALDSMRTTGCRQLLGVHLVERAGHWVQQEQPHAVTTLLLQFLDECAEAACHR
jgi:pimeloyl-ACP methyl ester carboxylesterase